MCTQTRLIANAIGTSNITVLEFPGEGKHALKEGFKLIEHDLSITPWPIEDGAFGVILANQVLEHMPNTDEFVSELRRILSLGGYAVISVPNLGSWINIMLLLLTIQPPHCWVSDKWRGVGNPLSSMRHQPRPYPFHSHLRLFTPRAMKELLEIYGFQVEHISGGSYGLPLILDRFATTIDKYHGIYTTVKARIPCEDK